VAFLAGSIFMGCLPFCDSVVLTVWRAPPLVSVAVSATGGVALVER
jgi:hypothetical protein